MKAEQAEKGRNQIQKGTNRMEKSKEKIQRPQFPTIEMNQTIIINHPSGNVNLCEKNKKFTSGINDNWSLNNNLKQFSETRRLGFYKQPQNLKRKTKTQDIKPNKIHTYPTNNNKVNIQNITTLRPIDRPKIKSYFQKEKYRKKKGQINSSIGLEIKTIDERNKLNQVDGIKCSKIDGLQPYLKTFMNEGHKKIGSNYHKFTHTHRNQTRSKPQLAATQRINQINQENQQRQKNEVKQNEPNSTVLPIISTRIFNQNINRINQSLLKDQECYLNDFSYQSIPSSKIELYVNSINRPEYFQHDEYRSSPIHFKDKISFMFDEDKNKTNTKKNLKHKKKLD